MRGFAILSAFQLVGTLIHVVGVPMPGAVIGLFLFTASLFLGWVKLEWVEDSSNFLLKHMLLFFVPMTVMTMRLASVLRANWAALTVSIFVSTLAVMATTGLVADLLLRRKERAVK
ncbi:MAG: CidA/LrgA family protein [Acidobacteriota bacterium]|nr:CidA/LrgA family protein [Acidobacteriota bacterium]